MRKPVSTVLMSDGDYMIVTCDDGSVWVETGNPQEPWREQPPIPGTLRDREKRYDRELEESFQEGFAEGVASERIGQAVRQTNKVRDVRDERFFEE